MAATTPTGRVGADRISPVSMVVLMVTVAYTLFPLYWLFIASTKSGGSLFTTFGLWFDDPTDFFDNVRETFTYQNGVYLLWLRNTALYSFTSALGSSLIASLAGYAFAKYRFRGREFLFSVVLGSIMVPLTALVIPLFLIMVQVGLVNTPWAFILPSLVAPFSVYLMRVFAQGAVPDELIEAARVDGAGELRILLTVASRLLLPGFVTVFLFSLVASWNNYFLPLVVFSDPKLYPLTVGLASWNANAAAGGGSRLLFPIVITGSLIAIVPLIAMFIALQRYWKSGLSLGAVK
ncbi:MAG: carbohydrate ABC transporter permease [Nitriliruptoraceae bacterium]|nr:carbohydrate ABC transporter permease [Nitriliruptoraceae bacterium]